MATITQLKENHLYFIATVTDSDGLVTMFNHGFIDDRLINSSINFDNSIIKVDLFTSEEQQEYSLLVDLLYSSTSAMYQPRLAQRFYNEV